MMNYLDEQFQKENHLTQEKLFLFWLHIETITTFFLDRYSNK